VNPDGTQISYTYDAAGNRTSVTVPSGTTVYEYDELNRLSEVKDPFGNTTTYTYDAVGNKLSISYSNGTITEYTYDKLYRLTKMETRKVNGDIISSYEYTLGLAGNRLKVSENTGRVVEYSYDDTYKLVEEKITMPSGDVRTISYTYDAVGNRLTKTDGTKVTNYVYDINNRLIKEDDNTYTYDNNGNTISKSGAGGTVTYSYNYNNQLIKAVTRNADNSESIVEYVYDSNGIRVQKKVDGEKIINYIVDKNRDYAQVLEERDDSGNLIVSYVYGDDLINQNRNGSISFYHFDGNSSTRVLTDISGEVTDTYTYDAFGVLIGRTGTTENHYLYTGQQYDANVGFYYLRARYMDPAIGRFISMDSYWGSSYDPVSLHKYLYANANPMTYYDPSGYFSISHVVIGIAISSVLAGIVSGVFAYLRTGSLKEALWSGVKSAAFSAVMSIICLKFPAVVPYLLSFGIGTIAYQILTGEFDGMDAAEIATHIVVQTIFWSLFRSYAPGLGSGAKSNVKKNPFENIEIDTKQLGKKWGKHKYDYPQLKDFNEYVNLIDDVFHNYDRIIYDSLNGEYYYIKGSDLLRVGEAGNFISLYPGAGSQRVINAINNMMSQKEVDYFYLVPIHILHAIRNMFQKRE